MHPSGIQKRFGAYLPHWTRERGIYAVRFRLGDSLPQTTLKELQRERAEILRAAGTRNITGQERLRLLELHGKAIERFLDNGRGACWMQRPEIAAIVAGALRHFEPVRYRLFAWCVMPNHMHVVVQPCRGHALSDILRSWKGFSAREANRILGRSGAFWQPECYDRLIRTSDELYHHIGYAWINPDVAGLKDWRWRWKMPEGELQAFLRSPESPWNEEDRS